jgi:hypothetical protein
VNKYLLIGLVSATIVGVAGISVANVPTRVLSEAGFISPIPTEAPLPTPTIVEKLIFTPTPTTRYIPPTATLTTKPEAVAGAGGITICKKQSNDTDCKTGESSTTDNTERIDTMNKTHVESNNSNTVIINKN